jgi:flagellar basal body-associated protein FliL
MGKLKMTVLSVLALSSADIGNTRLIILMLLIVAVVLILIGCLIALMTLRKRLKSQNVENERP